jgi:hypothetical protein
MQQGIGVIQGTGAKAYESSGFSNGFSLGYKRFVNEQ